MHVKYLYPQNVYSTKLKLKITTNRKIKRNKSLKSEFNKPKN